MYFQTLKNNKLKTKHDILKLATKKLPSYNKGNLYSSFEVYSFLKILMLANDIQSDYLLGQRINLIQKETGSNFYFYYNA